MPRWLFPHLLDDPKEYLHAQELWEDLFRSSLSFDELGLHWQIPHFENRHRDGNPIFTAVCARMGVGIRIIQEQECKAGDVDFDWWIDYVGPKTSSTAIRELVIACCPSTDNLDDIAKVMREWLERGEVTVSPATTYWQAWHARSIPLKPKPRLSNFEPGMVP